MTRRGHRAALDTSPARRRGCPRAGFVGALVLALLLSACSGPGGGGDEPGTVDRIAAAVERAIAQAKERRQGASGGTEGEAAPGTRIEAGANETFDYTAYQNTLKATIALLEEYWAQALPELGARYTRPRGYSYYRSDEGGGPRCGDEAAPPRNAFYCPAGDFIAWDESGLMIPELVQGGDFAASFVLAHEFGHAMQVRLPRQETVGLLRELQADCFAGAWSRFVSERRLLEAGDLDEATMAVFTARDVPGTPFTDPRAHGSGFERTRAFADGFEDGAGACYPAPAEEWVLETR